LNLRVVIHQPWEVGYGIKHLIDDADVQFLLSHAGWVGELTLMLPRPDYDDVRLGDEVKVIDESGKVWWLGKIVRQRFTHERVQQIQVRGLMEFFFDLPVDCVLAQPFNWQAGALWQAACQVARSHWSRVLVPSRVVTDDVGSNQVDFRGQPLGAVYRFLLDKGLDVVLEVSEETATGRVKPSLISRHADPVTLPIEQFAEWEINYDAAGVQNRLLLVPTDAEIYKNLLTDGSFEDFNAAAWEVSGTGTDWSVERNGIYLVGERIFGMMEGTVLRVFIPAQNPAGTVTVQTREQLEMPTGTLKISVWAYASSSGGTIQAFFGSVFGAALTIQQGINRYEWTFSVSSGAKGKIGFKVTGQTTVGTTVYLDGASASLWNQANTLLRPVGSQEDFVSNPQTFLSRNNFFRVLRVTQNGSFYDLTTDRTAWQQHGTDRRVSSIPVGTTGELWDYYFQREWRFTVMDNYPSHVLTVRIDRFPPGNPVPYEGCLGRLFFWEGDQSKGMSEVFYGVRYGDARLPSALGWAWLRTVSKPTIVFEGTLTGVEFLVEPTTTLRLLNFGPAEISVFPIVENQVTVKAGVVVAQKIRAGDRDLTFRGLLRKQQQELKNYVIARTK
jgi:hypothetical protein